MDENPEIAKWNYIIQMKVYYMVWVGFYGTSTLVGYSMPNPLSTCILNIYDLETHFIDNIFKWTHAHSFGHNQTVSVISNMKNSIYY